MARILIIEDEESVRSMLRDMLEPEGHAVVEARDGQEAAQYYQQPPVDLVVTDILMPNKGGLVTIREIRAVWRDTPILAISGGGRSGRLNFLSTARTFPNVTTLEKPFRRLELLRLVGDALAAHN